MTGLVPSYLEADLADYDRGAYSEDFERCMEFFGDLIRHGAVPWKIEARVAKAIEQGYLSTAGDVLLRDHEAPSHWDVSLLDS